MAGGALKELNKHIAENRYAAAYYFYGDEEFQKDAALQLLLGSALEAATRDFNLDQRRAGALDARTLGTLLATPPMQAQRRLLVLRDAASLKRDARATLERYLEAPARDIIVVLVSAVGEKVDTKLTERTTAFEFTPLNATAAVEWMMEHARAVHGSDLQLKAAELLLAASGSDLATLAAEIDKCVSYSGGVIDPAAVEAVVGVRHGETLGDLLQAVAQRRAAEAMRLVTIVLAQPKNSLVSVLSALGTQLMAIGVARAARQNGASLGAIRGRLWDMLKGGGLGPVNTGGPWGEAVDRWSNAVALWSEEDIQRGLQSLLLSDRAAKDSRIASDEQLLSNVVLELCGVRKRAAA
jgi:DNA polymerase-3 subunit delta